MWCVNQSCFLFVFRCYLLPIFLFSSLTTGLWLVLSCVFKKWSPILSLNKILILFTYWRQYFMQFKLDSNLLCNWGWPWTSDFLASTTQAFGLIGVRHCIQFKQCWNGTQGLCMLGRLSSSWVSSPAPSTFFQVLFSYKVILNSHIVEWNACDSTNLSSFVKTYHQQYL